MVTSVCKTCETEWELGIDEFPGWCSDEEDVVRHLGGGGSAEELGLDAGSRLVWEAIREVQARRRAERIYIRDQREREYERSRPRPMRPIYPV